MITAIQLYLSFSTEKLEHFLHDIDGVIEVEQCILKQPIVSFFASLYDTSNNNRCFRL